MAFVYWIHLPEHTDMFSQGYVGFTSKTVEFRYAQHQYDAGTKDNKSILHKAILKYGDALVVDTLVDCDTEYGLDLERELRPTPCIGWNLITGGRGGSLGHKCTDDTRRKMSEARKGKVASEETRAKLRANRHSDETRKKISDAHKGKPKSEDHAAKARLASVGCKRSDEFKANLSEFRKGLCLMTPEGKKRLAESKKALRPWETSRGMNNLDVWSNATTAYDMYINGTLTRLNFAKIVGVKVGAVGKLYSDILSGWVPSDDKGYLAWLEEFKGDGCNGT